MECASEPDGIAAGTEPRSRRAAVYQDRPAPPPPDGRAFLCPDPAGPAARDPRGCALPFARRTSLWRRLRPRENAATLLRSARAATLALAGLAVLAVGLPEHAEAQTEVPADWALKPADIAAGGQFRLMFVSSTTRDATSTDIAAYNTFVSTRAAAGVTAMQTYADDFTALVSTESVNARTNTLTRATDTDAPIYRARSGTVSANDRVADDYADFYDGTWPTSALGYDESGTLVNIGLLYFWTGMNVDGTTHATEFMGASSLVRAWNVSASTVGSTNRGSSTTQRIVALSPVFQVATATTNTAPTAANNTVTTAEDRAYAFTAADFGFDDADAGATLASVTIVTVPAAGTLALDGTAVLAAAVVTKAQIDDSDLTFTPARDAHGAPYTTFTFTVNDGTDDSASAYTMTIDVTDAPLPVCGVPDIAGAGRRQIWSGTVMVEEFSFMGSVTGYGFDGVLPAGTLLPSQSFFIGSNNYVIDAITVSLSGSLHFSLDGFSFLTATETAALRLHVCDGDYDFDTANNSQQNTTTWSTSLDWSDPVVTRTVYLSLPANNVATGEPAMTGTAQAGQELTADASPIEDTDGLTDVDFTYQWLRVDADGTSNEEDISGETDATYTLTAADAGKKIKVQVSFTDELSGEEMRTSAAYPSSGTVTAATTTAPALLSVTVTSTPHQTTDTYGAREHIEFSMTFDAPVTVTGDPTFAFDLGGASTATYYAGSGTTTLRFSHAVSGGSSGDQDTNGISWAANAIALNGGTIAGTDNAVAAVLTHVAQPDLPAHKVDGRTTAVTPATVTVAVTSTPTSLADTYGFGETIVITVTASEAVEVVGDPEFEFSMNNPGGAANDVPATYDGTRSSPTTIVFTYTVQAGDMDSDGIWIGDHSRTFMLDVNDRIRTASQQIDIDRSHPEKGTLAGHKVNGSLGAPTVPPDPTAPTLVSATATTLTIEWTHPGDGGSPLTRNFIEYRVEGTTDWTNWYRGETPTPVTRTVITNLAAATAYDVRVHATNAIGNSQWTQSATAFSTLVGGTAICPVPTFTGRRKIWTGVLTMGDFNDVDLSLRGYHSNPESGDGGGLDPATFTLGSRDYDVRRIALVTSGASGLHFIAGRGDGVWWDSTVDALRLHVCNTNFDFSDSVYHYEDEDRGRIASNHLWTTDLDWSGVTTRTVHLSLPLNRPATGAPVITGPATVGQVLAVDVTGIEDEDGLHEVEYTYQWVRVDADGMSNEADITDATDATYTLTDDDLGKKVKIEVSFPDDFGSDEQRTSAPTDTVTAVAMTTPGVTVSTTALTVTEEDTTGDSYTVVLDSQPTANVTVTVAGHAGTDVTPSPTSLTFTTSTWGTAQTVTVTAGDDADTANDAVSLTHSAASTDTDYDGISIDGVAVTVNDNDTAPATGAPTITGTAQVGQTLTAVTTGIMDADGLTSPTYTYQWIRVDGTDEADIASANSSTYILGDADLGTTLKVRVTFDDDLGHTETLTSAATATVGAVATGPPTVNDVAVTSTPASGTTYYLADEVIEFTVTFSAPVTVTATPKFAFRLGAATRQAAYASGSDSAALVFARTVQAGEVDRNGISWNAIALALDGGTITQTGATTAARLTHAAQAPLEGHRVDAAPPMQVSASVQGLSLVLVYDEPLDPASMPATGAYTVTATVGATTTNPAVSEVSIYGIWVTLTLDAPPAAGATVTLAYAPPASNPVQDEAGNDAPAFSGQKVNGAAGNTAPTGAPTITGTAQVGQTLTAVTTGIADADGLTSPTYTYQWIRVNGTEADIAGENSSTYILVDADLDKTLKVRVTFADDLGHTETLTSAATATVVAAATAALGQVMGVGVAPGNAQLVVTWTAVDTATGYTVQWMSGSQGYNTGDRQAPVTSGSTTSHTIEGLANGTEYTVRVIATRTGATDGPPSEEMTGTPRVPPPPPPPPPPPDLVQVMGVGVAPGNAQLVVTWTAVDTATGYTVQWMSGSQGYNTGDRQAPVTSGSTTSHTIEGLANGTEYTVRVIATRTGATDGPPSEEMTGTPRVPPPPPPPPPDLAQVNDVAVTSTPASGTTYYLAGEVIEFTVTFSAPVTVTGTPKFAFRLGAATRQAAYASGSDSAALVFARTVQAGEVDRNGISWNAIALALDGGTITQTGATTAARLTHAAQAPLEGHRVDAAPPMQVSASVQGLALVLVYDEPLDPASMPATGAYTVTATVGATTTNPAVSEVSIYGIWVTLTLDAAPAAGATVTLAYAPPASNPVQDEAGNDAPAFSGQSVRLGPPPPPVTDLEQVMGVGVVPGNAQLVVTWTAVDTATGYTVQWTSGGEDYNTGDRQATVTSGSTTHYTIPSLTNGTEYTVQVIATRTGATDGPPSAEETGTPTGEPGVTVSPTALTVTEEDTAGATYTVVLDSQPTATVTVTVAGHAGTDVSLTPSSATLTFTPTNWDTAQTVTVTAGADADTANESVLLTHSAASTDSDYQGISIAGVAVTVTDNDVPVVPNNAPTVSSVSCDPCAVAPGGEVRLSAEASDPDGDSLTYAWSAPTGSFTGATDGAAARWRAPAETARVTVRVQVSDGRGGTASATATVEVTNAPPAFEQSSYGFELPEHEDGRRRPVALGAVKAEDPDGDAVTYSLASGDGERFAVGAHDGAVTYVGAGEDFEAEPNQYELSVRARDQHGAAARVRVTVAVTNANEPPSAEDDEAGTAEDQRVVIDVLANDTDPDGDSLRVESVSAPAHGMARVASRGGVAYTPDADYHGMDRFTYVVADGHGETAAATVEVTVAPVNDAPMAAGIIPDQRLSVGDEPGSLDLRPFFDDRDGDPLSYTAVASDTAVAVGLTDATLTLTVARPGAAMVTVTAQDPGGLTATQAFMVTMTDRQARGVIEDTLAALGRGHLASARATLGRRVETTGQEPSHVTVAGLHVPLGAGARAVAAAGQAVAERWITGLAGGMPLQTGGWTGTDAVGAPGSPAATLGMAGGAPFGAADPAQLGARATPALSGVSPFGGGGQTDVLLTLGTGQAGSDAAQGPRWTVWGQSDLQSFAGERSPTARYDGELWTTYVGVDARLSERWLAGVAVSRSRGNGDWTVGSSTGRLTTTLTSVQPYLRWSDGGTTIWATGGGGPGTARNALYGLQAESDLELRLGLVEVRRRLATVGGGVELQLRGDASWARLTTAEGDGLIDALAVEVRQLRVGIDVSRPVRTAGGTLVEPFGEVHARRDGGSGQTGAGLEVAGGLRVARGVFRVEGMGRLLALHAADGYRERGAAVTLSVGDGARQPGLTLSLSPRWGAQATASDALWQDHLFQQRTAGDPGARRDERALDTRVDYGLQLPAGGLLTPFGIYGQSRYGRRLQVGLRLSRVGPVGLEVSGERAALRQPGRDEYRISALGSITFGGADHAPASLSAGQEAHRPRARDHTPRHR